MAGACSDLRALGLRPRAGPSSRSRSPPGRGVWPSPPGRDRGARPPGRDRGARALAAVRAPAPLGAAGTTAAGFGHGSAPARPWDPQPHSEAVRGSPRRRGPVPCLRQSVSSPHTCSQEAPRIARGVPAPDAAARFLRVGSTRISEGLPSPRQAPSGSVSFTGCVRGLSFIHPFHFYLFKSD